MSRNASALEIYDKIPGVLNEVKSVDDEYLIYSNA